jgi:hypothetical protein
LTSFQRLGQKSFHSILVEMMVTKGHFDIN